jgi:hypothetical protein
MKEAGQGRTLVRMDQQRWRRGLLLLSARNIGHIHCRTSGFARIPSTGSAMTRPIQQLAAGSTALILVLLLANSGGAMETATQRQATGLGTVGKQILGETDCSSYATADQGVPLFLSLTGQPAAAVAWKPGGMEGCVAVLVRGSTREPLNGSPDVEEISYESAALVYYEARDGYAKVFAKTAPPGYWVRIRDMPGGKLHPWAEFLVAGDHFGYRGYDGLDLHQRPDDTSPVAVKLREPQAHPAPVHQLIASGEISGEWGKFDVVEFNGDFSPMAEAQATPTGRKWTGWLRLSGPQGRSFWFYTRD